MKNLSQDTHCPGRDSNLAPNLYKSRGFGSATETFCVNGYEHDAYTARLDTSTRHYEFEECDFILSRSNSLN
jgi:hypothetical protein